MVANKHAGADPRRIAARVVERVETDGAFAAAALDAELRRAVQLSSRDRGLATQLVYGTLRSQPALLQVLEGAAPKGVKDAFVRAHLLVALHQLLQLDRIPAHAAVDAAVSAVRGKRGPRVAGFVNAVLRRIGATPPPLDADRIAAAAFAPWLRTALTEVVPEHELPALLGFGVEGSAQVSVRVRGDRPAPPWATDLPRGDLSPLAYRVTGGGDPRTLGGYDDGAYVVQEEGAQVVGLALGARSGERVLDACAGRGQKTSLLAEQVGPGGVVWAADLYPGKLDALGEELLRLGLPPVRTAAVDWSVGAGSVPEGFDRVLVDAPCTGVGTLRRRPEILRRLEAASPERLASLAEAILRRAAERAKEGGRVVFAVCSILRAESEAVVERVADVLEPVPFDAPDIVERFGEVTSLRLLPHVHGTDGYFVASLRRR